MNQYKNLFTLAGKKAFVVGAGGLGSEIAHGLLQNGADLAIADINLQNTDTLVQTAQEENRKLLKYKINILDSNSIQQVIDNIYEEFGRIDILVNAVGINSLKKIEDYDEETWDKVIDINLKGTHLVTKAVGKIMIKQTYGRILNISSVRSILGMSQDYIAYCASKGAINMYTKQVACEWAKYNITCNALAPTFTRTPINSFQLDDPVFYQKLIDRIPLGRICTTLDIVGASIYLCSDAAAFVTGQILGIDGGLTITQ